MARYPTTKLSKKETREERKLHGDNPAEKRAKRRKVKAREARLERGRTTGRRAVR